jgi:hypothetical protein
MGGQLGSVVEDPELAVLDDHGDDLATVDVAEVDLYPATIRPPWLETTCGVPEVWLTCEPQS